MKYMGVNELREKFLQFWETKDHLRHDSYSLIPENDKSLLLIESWGLRSSHCRAKETSSRLVSRT